MGLIFPPSVVENMEFPTGVFTVLTDCYSPTCSREKGCYSSSCPRKSTKVRVKVYTPIERIIKAGIDFETVTESSIIGRKGMPYQFIDILLNSWVVANRNHEIFGFIRSQKKL